MALTLVVAVATPSLAKCLPKYGDSTDAMSLLGLAEEILQTASLQSDIARQCVAYLQNVKENMINNNNNNDNNDSNMMNGAISDEHLHDVEVVVDDAL